MKRIGVLTSGGDAPGMNAAVRSVVRCGTGLGLEVVGIRRGYAGLLEQEFVELGARSVANILHRGGTILGTARCEEMRLPEGLGKGVAALREASIEGLVAIGGDGTFHGAQDLAELTDIHIVGMPGTIDNDVYGTDFTIGFDTAVNTAVEAIDRIRDTAEAHQRLFFVEVMGRTRGFIALAVAVACGAEDVLVPEVRTDLDELCANIQSQFAGGKRASIIVVAEGDDAGRAFEVAHVVAGRLEMDYRVCVIGHVQRGGAPSARDRLLASRLGAGAVRTLAEGRTDVMVGEIGGEIVETPLEQTWSRRKELDTGMLQLMRTLAR